MLKWQLPQSLNTLELDIFSGVNILILFSQKTGKNFSPEHFGTRFLHTLRDSPVIFRHSKFKINKNIWTKLNCLSGINSIIIIVNFTPSLWKFILEILVWWVFLFKCGKKWIFEVRSDVNTRVPTYNFFANGILH